MPFTTLELLLGLGYTAAILQVEDNSDTWVVGSVRRVVGSPDTLLFTLHPLTSS